VLAPIGQFPVREADILERSGLQGNLVVPFSWGSYSSWRLYPHIKVSIDGRYEAAYPESTFAMNQDFVRRRGADWDRILKQHPVDFIILDYQNGALHSADLVEKGYHPVWESRTSALLAHEEHLARLRETALNLPPTTIEPLDARIAQKWCRSSVQNIRRYSKTIP
jgi:hypothetical protein